MGTANFHLDAFRAVADSSKYSDSRHVYIANSDGEKSKLAFNGAKNYIDREGDSFMLRGDNQKPRTFKKPGKADAVRLQQDATFMRSELLRAASAALGGMKGAYSEVLGEIEKKLFGDLADKKNVSFTQPLRKRDIMDVVKMVDDKLAGNPNLQYDAASSGRKNSVKTKQLCAVLDNEDQVQSASQEEITLGSDLTVDAKADKCPCTKNPFKAFKGGSSAAAKMVHDECRAKGTLPKILMQVFADATYFLCYFRNPKCNSQEEFVSHDTEPKSFLNVVKNFVKKVGKRFEYLTDKLGKPLLSTMAGWMKKCQLKFVGDKRLNEPIDANYLFSSMPSMTDDPESFDVKGNAEYLCKCHEQLMGKTFTKEERDNVIAFVTKFNERRYKDWKNGTRYKNTDNKVMCDGLTGKQFRDAVMMMYGNQDLMEDVLKGKISSSVKALRTLVKRGNYADKLAEAKTNYENSIRSSVRTWIVMARKAGLKHFIGGAIGTGAFKNDLDTIARIVAEEFIQYGGGMEYVFPELKDYEREAFEKAFAAAYEKYGQKGAEAAPVNT